MCAYYWSYINELYLEELSKIPRGTWLEIDYTSVREDDILRIGEFLGLKGLFKFRIQNSLDRKINSLRERTGEERSYPHWTNWSTDLRKRFDRMAANTMQKIGYYGPDDSNWHQMGSDSV
jgi:hypothetical protein